MMLKKGLALALSVLLVLALAACGGTPSSASTPAASTPAASSAAGSSTPTAEGGEIRVAWWGTQARHNATIEALDLYAAEHNVTFSYEYTSWDSYFENLATQSVGNDLPDVIQMSMDNIIKYSQNGQIVDLGPYVSDGTIDTANVDEANLDAGSVDGVMTGYISGVNSVSVFYNKAVFDEAGVDYPADDWTWSDYLATAQAIFDATGIQTEIPFLSDSRWFAEHVARSYGYDYYDMAWGDDEKVTAGMAKAFGDVQSMIEAGVFVDPEVQIAWGATEDNYIVQGKSAMAHSLTNYYATYCGILGEELGIVVLPQMDDATTTGMYLNANMYWSISRDSADPAAAAKVLNYLVNDTTAAGFISTDRGISINSSIRDMLAGQADAYMANTLDYISSISAKGVATNQPDPVGSSEAMIALRTNYQALCYGEMTPEDCVSDYVAQARGILGQ